MTEARGAARTVQVPTSVEIQTAAAAFRYSCALKQTTQETKDQYLANSHLILWLRLEKSE